MIPYVISGSGVAKDRPEWECKIQLQWFTMSQSTKYRCQHMELFALRTGHVFKVYDFQDNVTVL